MKKIDLKFERGKNVIVGRNNSGKSNILKAIDLVLGEYSPTYEKSDNVSDNDFFGGDTKRPIFIWCEVQRESESGVLEAINFDDVKKTAFCRLYHDRHFTSEIRTAVTDFNKQEKVGIFGFNSERGEVRISSDALQKKWIGGKPYCKSTFQKEFESTSNFAFAFLCYKPGGVPKKELVFLYRENISCEWIIGLNCNLRNTIIQSAIIPAFRDPKDQLRINSYSWFGKLLKAYVKTDSTELNIAFEQVKTASDALFSALKNEIIKKEINIAFPNTSVSFQFNPSSKQDIHKSTLIYVDDGFNSELKDKGAGIQSALTISLYDFYVRNVAHSGSSLLAVEEPELYLHPHGRRVVSDRLTRFVDNGKNQVILTTHSPEFLCNIYENQNIICVTKIDSASKAKNIYFNTPKRKQVLIKKQNAELFFADAVILTEGEDKYFIEESSRCFARESKFVSKEGELLALSENWLNDFNVSIINCGGKTELWKYAEILNELSIKYIATADFDFFIEGLSDYLTNLKFSKDVQDALNKCKGQAILSGKIKSLSDITDPGSAQAVATFISTLRNAGLFIFSGELENFYKIKPKFTKAAGVFETLGKAIEDNKPLGEFVNTKEYFELFEIFVDTMFGYKKHLQ